MPSDWPWLPKKRTTTHQYFGRNHFSERAKQPDREMHGPAAALTRTKWNSESTGVLKPVVYEPLTHPRISIELSTLTS